MALKAVFCYTFVMAEILPDGSTIDDVRALLEPFEQSEHDDVRQAAAELLENLEHIDATGTELDAGIRAIYRRHYHHLFTLESERVLS